MFPHLETGASAPKVSHSGYADGLSEPIRCERSVIGKRAARRGEAWTWRHSAALCAPSVRSGG